MWPCAALWPLTASPTQLMWIILNRMESKVLLVYHRFYTCAPQPTILSNIKVCLDIEKKTKGDMCIHEKNMHTHRSMHSSNYVMLKYIGTQYRNTGYYVMELFCTVRLLILGNIKNKPCLLTWKLFCKFPHHKAGLDSISISLTFAPKNRHVRTEKIIYEHSMQVKITTYC